MDIGASQHQIADFVACARFQDANQRAFTVMEASNFLDVERTQAGRFLRAMLRRGYLTIVKGLTRHHYYAVTPFGRTWIRELQKSGQIPDRCHLCGKRAEPCRFRGVYLCRDCLTETGDTLNDLLPRGGPIPPSYRADPIVLEPTDPPQAPRVPRRAAKRRRIILVDNRQLRLPFMEGKTCVLLSR